MHSFCSAPASRAPVLYSQGRQHASRRPVLMQTCCSWLGGPAACVHWLLCWTASEQPLRVLHLAGVECMVCRGSCGRCSWGQKTQAAAR